MIHVTHDQVEAMTMGERICIMRDGEVVQVGAPLAVYDDHGSLIENPSQRYSFNSEEAIRRSDGTYHVNLASNARPENWLPTGTGPEKKLVLMLRIYSPREIDSSGIGQIPNDRLPKIERKACN